MGSQKPLNQLAREYFIRKLGGAEPTERLTSIQKKYFISQVGATSPNESLDSLEKRWLRDLVGGSSSEETELWAEAVLAEGGTPTKFVNQNKRIFFEIAS